MCKIASFFTVQQNQFGTDFIYFSLKQAEQIFKYAMRNWMNINQFKLLVSTFCQHHVYYDPKHSIHVHWSILGGKGGRKKNVKNFRLKGHPPSPVFMMATPSERPVQQKNKESFGWGGREQGQTGGPYFRGVNHHEVFSPWETPLVSHLSYTCTKKTKIQMPMHI